MRKNPLTTAHGRKLHTSFFRKRHFALVTGAVAIHMHAAEIGGSPAIPGARQAAARIESLDPFQAGQERLKKMLAGKPRAYEDKFMDPRSLPAWGGEDDATANAAPTGLRGYMLETRYGFAQAGGGPALRRAGELGLRAEYRQETLNYGDFVAQADMRHSGGEQNLGFGPLGYATEKSSARLTLRNLGFPVTPHVFADTSLGDIYSEVTDAFSRTYRLSLGSSVVRGFGTRVFDRSFDLRAGVGERGNLAGGPYPGFERNQGSLAWAGYSQRLAGNMFAGVQVNRAAGVPAWAFGAYAPTTVADDVTSVATTVGHGSELTRNGDHKARLMLVRSQTSAMLAQRANSAQGIFIEGGFRANGYRNELGVYSAGPNLRFGDYLLASDNRGAYWRVDHNATRLAWGLSLDHELQNPGRDAGRPSARRTGLSANAQYRLDRESSLGASINLGNTGYDTAAFAGIGSASRSLYANAFYQTRFRGWGRSRFRVTAHRNETLVVNGAPATGDEIEWEQDWITGKYETMRPEFITTLGLARDRSEGATQTQPTAGAVLRLWPDADWNISGSLRYTSRTGNLATSRGLSGTLGTEKVLGGGWRLGASASLNQAVVNIAPSVFIGPQVSRSNEKTAFVYLRWEAFSGATFQSAGLRSPAAAGAGSVSGMVFFDGDRDGEQQAGEDGVPNVEVLLDGRYRVTTDRSGRFDFPLVTTGHHQLTLQLESVPLPWGAAQDQGWSVDVPLRGQATVRIPVVRVGE